MFLEMGFAIMQKGETMGDTISRQAAISLAGDLQINGEEYHMYNQAINNYCTEIMGLPSTQHEIIHCKDCAYYGWDCVDMPYSMTGMIRWCNKFYTSENENIEVEPNDFCKWAERKVDE